MGYFKKFIAAMCFTLTAANVSVSQANESNDYILGTFFTSDKDSTIQCFLSKDGIHMEHWLDLDKTKVMGRDPSVQFYNDSFYLCLVDNDNPEQTFRLLKIRCNPDTSKVTVDPVESYKVVDRSGKYTNVWAPDLFIDKSGAAYVYFSKQKGVNSKTKERLFDIYVSESANIDENIFTPENTKKIELPQSSANYIDAQVRNVDGTYYMIVKNESWVTGDDNKSPILLKSKSPDAGFVEVENWPLKYIRGYEGFSILEKGNKIYIYGDNFARKYDDVGTSNHTVWVVDKNKIETGPYEAHYVDSDRSMRHGSLVLLDDNMKKLFSITDFDKTHKMSVDANQKASVNLKLVTLSKEDYGNGQKGKKNDIVIDFFAPARSVAYAVSNRTNVTIDDIRNPYGVKSMTVYLAAESSLKIPSANVELSVNKNEDDKKYILTIDNNGKILKCEQELK